MGGQRHFGQNLTDHYNHPFQILHHIPIRKSDQPIPLRFNPLGTVAIILNLHVMGRAINFDNEPC